VTPVASKSVGNARHVRIPMSTRRANLSSVSSIEIVFSNAMSS
jgi:hypothetical protein